MVCMPLEEFSNRANEYVKILRDYLSKSLKQIMFPTTFYLYLLKTHELHTREEITFSIL